MWIDPPRFFHNKKAGGTGLFQFLVRVGGEKSAPNGLELLFATLLISSRAVRAGQGEIPTADVGGDLDAVYAGATRKELNCT